MNESIAKKAYYSIGEVCDLTGLKPHVLRYWETQFDVLSPNKNRAGNRVFRPKEIEVILLVKHLLYEEKYTIEGARQRIDQFRRTGQLKADAREALQQETIESLRTELQNLLDILDRTKPLAPTD